MSLLAHLLEAVVISLSGVMAPGPITTVTVGKGSASPHAGALIAVGHGIVEFPLMMLIYHGFGSLLNLPYVKAGIALVGGLFLVVMSLDMFRGVKRVDIGPDSNPHSPLVAGVLLTIANPYFLIWWATVGATLILRSAAFGVGAVLAFAICHWLCDFLWCYFLSALSFKGGQFFGRAFQKVVFAVCGVLLLLYGAGLVADALRMLPA